MASSKFPDNCHEICGDGLNLGEHECDDNNTESFDGCDSSCKIERAWTCSSGNQFAKRDICKLKPQPMVSGIIAQQYNITLLFNESMMFNRLLPNSTSMKLYSPHNA